MTASIRRRQVVHGLINECPKSGLMTAGKRQLTTHVQGFGTAQRYLLGMACVLRKEGSGIKPGTIHHAPREHLAGRLDSTWTVVLLAVRSARACGLGRSWALQSPHGTRRCYRSRCCGT